MEDEQVPENFPEFRVEDVGNEIELGQSYPLQMLDFINEMPETLRQSISDALWLRSATKDAERWEWVEAGSLVGADLREWEVHRRINEWDGSYWAVAPLAASLRSETVDYGEDGFFFHDEYGKKVQEQPAFFREHLLLVHIGLPEYMQRRTDADFWAG